MSRILNALNREWSHLAGSTPAREAVTRWSRRYPVFGEAADLHDVVDLGHLSDTGDVVRRALAEMAPHDDLAARTLLQALLGGITTMAIRCATNTDSTDELVAIAWERIRTYPAHRPGSVAGNVLLDTRKRYFHSYRADPTDLLAEPADGPSAEDQALEGFVFAELADAARIGIISPVALEAIVRTRVNDESLRDVAADQQMTVKALRHRRWRAENRLRELPIAS